MIWDVDVRKRFTNARQSFDLRACFRSDAKRLVLFGPSGAGKSQTLKIITGLTTPDAGYVKLEGLPLFDSNARIDLPPQQRALGYVFQDYALFPHLTVTQNIAFALHSGLSNPRRNLQHASVTRWLEAFHLEAVAHQYPEQLSGGQRQRTTLARALRTQLRQELIDLQTQLNIPLILITHDEEDVECFKGAVLHIRDGRIVEVADVHDAASEALQKEQEVS